MAQTIITYRDNGSARIDVQLDKLAVGEAVGLLYLAADGIRNYDVHTEVSTETGKTRMVGAAAFMKQGGIKAERKGNLSKACWAIVTLLPFIKDLPEAEVGGTIAALVGDRSFTAVSAEADEVRGVGNDKAADTFDKAFANFVTRCEALGLTVEHARAGDYVAINVNGVES